jgi:hypothetical protein
MQSVSKVNILTKIYPFQRIRFWDVLIGIPAGVLIFMLTVLFNTLFSSISEISVFVPLLILAIVSLLVGELAGLSRLAQGPATALAAGLFAAGLLGYLWVAARPGDIFNTLVVGPAGMCVTIASCPIGGWLGARLIKAL